MLNIETRQVRRKEDSKKVTSKIEPWPSMCGYLVAMEFRMNVHVLQNSPLYMGERGRAIASKHS